MQSLLLLRHLNAPSGTLTISKIADILDHTEKDVIRALNYWKRQGLLEYENHSDTKKQAAPSPADVPDIRQYKSRKEFKELLLEKLFRALTLTGLHTFMTHFICPQI